MLWRAVAPRKQGRGRIMWLGACPHSRPSATRERSSGQAPWATGRNYLTRNIHQPGRASSICVWTTFRSPWLWGGWRTSLRSWDKVPILSWLNPSKYKMTRLESCPTREILGRRSPWEKLWSGTFASFPCLSQSMVPGLTGCSTTSHSWPRRVQATGRGSSLSRTSVNRRDPPPMPCAELGIHGLNR